MLCFFFCFRFDIQFYLMRIKRTCLMAHQNIIMTTLCVSLVFCFSSHALTLVSIYDNNCLINYYIYYMYLFIILFLNFVVVLLYFMCNNYYCCSPPHAVICLLLVFLNFILFYFFYPLLD